jgi:hypothetical protein
LRAALLAVLACTITTTPVFAQRRTERITTLAIRPPLPLARLAPGLFLWWQPADENEAPVAGPPAPELPTVPAPEAPPAAEPTETDANAEAELDAELLRQVQEAEDAANADAEGGAKAKGEVIMVTGSAIERAEVTTAAPVSVIDKAELDSHGTVAIGDILQDIPSQSNAINVQFNNGGDGSTRVSLRGLGAGRTLVLLNGRRHVPGGTGVDSSVDLNAIPLAIIERVERTTRASSPGRLPSRAT